MRSDVEVELVYVPSFEDLMTSFHFGILSSLYLKGYVNQLLGKYYF
jgi:hypothetical protein